MVPGLMSLTSIPSGCDLHLEGTFSSDDIKTTQRRRHAFAVSSDSQRLKVALSRSIADILNHSCLINDPQMTSPHVSDPEAYFYSSGMNHFSLQEYLDHVIDLTDCSPSVYILGLAYMMRAQKANSKFLICSVNVHRLYVSCIIIAAKYLEFAVLSNADFGKACGIDEVCDTNQLEILMLKTLKYNLKCDRLKFKVLFNSIMN